MLHIITTSRYVFIMVLLTAVAILGWTGGAAMAADNMAKKSYMDG